MLMLKTSRSQASNTALRKTAQNMTLYYCSGGKQSFLVEEPGEVTSLMTVILSTVTVVLTKVIISLVIRMRIQTGNV